MDSHDDEIEMTIEPEEPTRPAWLLTDPTEVIDEPPLGGPYDPPPSMVTAPARLPKEMESTVVERAPQPSTARAALFGAVAGAVVAALVSFGIVSATDDDGGGERVGGPSAPVAVANGQALD